VIPVVADADTLFGATTRGLLIHLDYQGLIHLHWSPLILDELSRALVDTGRKPDTESARRHEQLMRSALPQAEITTQQVQAQFANVALAVRSTKDTHVAACARAILTGDYYPDTQVVSLVTRNIRNRGRSPDYSPRTRRGRPGTPGTTRRPSMAPTWAWNRGLPRA
jgi:hypothetical protein